MLKRRPRECEVKGTVLDRNTSGCRLLEVEATEISSINTLLTCAPLQVLSVRQVHVEANQPARPGLVQNTQVHKAIATTNISNYLAIQR